MNPTIIAEIAALTDHNLHTASLMVLARALGDSDALAELDIIFGVVRLYGYIPQPQYTLRRKISDRLLAAVEARYGSDTLAAVRGPL